MKRDIKKLSRRELEELMDSLGEPAWRVEEVLRWLYRNNADSIDSMTSLPRPLRERLADSYAVFLPAVEDRQEAPDGTVKLLLALEDAHTCETVVIPQEGRLTQCLSSQSGCPLRCSFCLTGRMGLKRNLAPSEIADQWLAVRRDLGPQERITNLVFMGMGEPLLNYESLREAVGIFTAPWGGGLSPSRITVSTAGIVPAIERMAVEMPGINLAVSLNAADDALRDRLMPVNRKYPLRELVAALRRYRRGRRPLTVEYVLLGGVNDSPEAAASLGKLLRGVRCKINLIPFNPHSDLPFAAPTEEAIVRFRERLLRAGFSAPVRRSKGSEISAACGQLGARERGVVRKSRAPS